MPRAGPFAPPRPRSWFASRGEQPPESAPEASRPRPALPRDC
jgi:hypothetical protein